MWLTQGPAFAFAFVAGPHAYNLSALGFVDAPGRAPGSGGPAKPGARTAAESEEAA